MTWSTFAAQLSVALIPVIATGLTALIGVGIAYLSAKVKAKYGEQAQAKADEYLNLLQDVADHTVIALQQSTVDRLKASGQWNEDTAAQVKADAVNTAVESLGALRDQIEQRLLLDVPKYMAALIEVALHDHKEYTAAGQFAAPLMIEGIPVTPDSFAPAPVDQQPVKAS